jgi:type II secretion system protein N
MMSDRVRRLWRIGATAAFGLFVFFVVFVLTLPYGRLKDYLVALAEQQGYDIEAKAAGPALGLGIRLKDITIASRPTGGGKPTRIVVPVAKVRWSLLGALAGRKTYQVSARVFGGDLDVEATQRKTESGLDISANAIALSEIPWVKAAINLPLSGTLDLRLDEKMPGLRVAATTGSLTWTCKACAVGDGKAKLIIPGNPLLAEGLGLPRIRLGDFVGRVSIDKGVGRLQGAQAKSPDGELTLEGEIRLATPLASSSLDLYVRFKLSDALLKSSEKLRTLMQFAALAGKRPDGFYGFRVKGPLNHLGNPEWTKTSPFGAPASGPKSITPKSGAALPSPARAAGPVAAVPAAAPTAPPAVNPTESAPASETPTPPAAEPAPPPPPPPPGAPPVIKSPDQEPPSMRVTDQDPPPPTAEPAPPPAAPTPGPAPPASPVPSPAPPASPVPSPAPPASPAPGPAPPAAGAPASSAPKSSSQE